MSNHFVLALITINIKKKKQNLIFIYLKLNNLKKEEKKLKNVNVS